MFSLYHRGGGNASVGYKFADSSKPAILTAMTPKKIFLTESGQAKNWTSAWFNRPNGTSGTVGRLASRNRAHQFITPMRLLQDTPKPTMNIL
jgi:hypothetical protein